MNRTHLLLLPGVSILLITSMALPFPLSPQTHSDDKKERKKFGSSLKQLKWDPKKRAAVEKEEKDEKKKQGQSRAQSEDVIKLETLLVTFDVLVTDPATSRVITGLKKEDFVIIEEGREQHISMFAPGNEANLPRSIILIMDYSTSMNAYFETSMKAVEKLVNQLSDKDRMAIITDDVELLCDFTSDKRQLVKTLDKLKARWRDRHRGRSKQFSALFAAIREMVDNESRNIIIFQTDGDEAILLRDSKADQIHGALTEFGFFDIETAAEKAGLTIYAVIPGERILQLPYLEVRKIAERTLNRARAIDRNNVPDPGSWIRLILPGQAATEHIANLTGGRIWYLKAPDQAEEIYSEIYSDISQRYFLGYYPTLQSRDGERRQSQIQVRGHPEYDVRGRQAYYIPKSQE